MIEFLVVLIIVGLMALSFMVGRMYELHQYQLELINLQEESRRRGREQAAFHKEMREALKVAEIRERTDKAVDMIWNAAQE